MNNFINSPKQMLLSKMGIPHLDRGGSLTAGSSQLLQSAVKNFMRVMKRPPSTQEMQELTSHAQSFSKPTNQAVPNMARLEAETPAQDMLVDASGRAYRPAVSAEGRLTTPEQAQGYKNDPFGTSAANTRARSPFYEPNVRAFEDRDPFLTEAMTGRAPTRTRQKAFTTNIDDLIANKAALENQGIFGNVHKVGPGEYPAQSVTPSADYFAKMSESIENAKLPSNIRSTLRNYLKREPTEDEINAAIASGNFAQHNYTGKGTAVFGERPAPKQGRMTAEQKAELDAWREQARLSGMSPTAVNATPGDLRDKFPKMAEQLNLGPDTGFKSGGSTTPDQLRAEMIAYGRTPEKFAKGKEVLGKGMSGAVKGLGAYGLGTSLANLMPDFSSRDLGETVDVQSGNPGEIAQSAMDAAMFGTMLAPKMFNPAFVKMSGTPLAGVQAATYSSNLGENNYPEFLRKYLGLPDTPSEQEQLKLMQGYINPRLDPAFEGSVFSSKSN